MRLIIAIVALLAAMSSAVAQTAESVDIVLDTVFGEHEKFVDAFAVLQDAVAADDAEAVAALAAYPLVVKVGERREIGSPEEFVAHYDEIMTSEIVATVIRQEYGTLFANEQGIMFGNGEVWMSGVCADDTCAEWDVLIITIQSTAQ